MWGWGERGLADFGDPAWLGLMGNQTYSSDPS